MAIIDELIWELDKAEYAYETDDWQAGFNAGIKAAKAIVEDFRSEVES